LRALSGDSEQKLLMLIRSNAVAGNASVAPLPSDSPVTLKTVMKISNKENLDARCSEFTTVLLH
jgi:hypothetical protein